MRRLGAIWAFAAAGSLDTAGRVPPTPRTPTTHCEEGAVLQQLTCCGIIPRASKGSTEADPSRIKWGQPWVGTSIRRASQIQDEQAQRGGRPVVSVGGRGEVTHVGEAGL